MNPALVRRLIIPIHERLLGRGTMAYLRTLDQTQWLAEEALRDLQTRKLRALLCHAAERSPFHARRLEAAGIHPAAAVPADLVRLPTLSKDDVRAHASEIIETAPRRQLISYSTGGSAGDPLLFKIDRSRQSADQAARARSRQWFGIDLGEREAYLWGSPVEHSAQDRLKSFRDRVTNHLLLNAFRMTPARMTAYLARIRAFDPVHIFGYPSSIAQLLRHARSTGDRLNSRSLRAIFTTGEILDPRDRALIEEETSLPVADGYGSREAGFIAHQCPQGRYHVTMESMIVELLDENGCAVARGVPGEITVTHLDAFGMPFIRYRTGDIASMGSGPCPCGRALETLEGIQGRRTDMLRTADGGFAHALAVIYVLREEPSIRQFQIVQRSDFSLDVALEGPSDLEDGLRERLTQGLRARIGPEVGVRIELVERIVPAPSGKHRCVMGPSPD